jgi:ATP-dependent helicase/nuclease subunit B
LWSGEDGEAAADFIRDVLEHTGPLPPIPPREYPALLDTLMSSRVLRPRYGRHPRLYIWGPLEARLQSASVVILGGLNEGTWPPEPPNDPWLSRPMRKQFGLPSPERRIGLSAHDFAQAACAPRVVLCRSEKVHGSPTVPARWLLRLKAFVGDQAVSAMDETALWCGWHQQLDAAPLVAPVSPPRPAPPVAARPRRLSVTGVQTWRCDPYAIYARKILGLEPLLPLDADPGAAERGTFIHTALEMFVREQGARLADDAFEQLTEFGRQAFGDAMARPTVWAFWWPRFLQVAHWFLEIEEVRRAEFLPAAVEVEGRLELPGPAGPFLLTAKADRIDKDTDGALEIIDYKTGAPPSPERIKLGYAPQLPLEAVIAAAGGFEGVSSTVVRGFSYWRLSGGEPAGKIKPYGGAEAAELAAAAREGLENLVAAFDRPETPYLHRPRPEFSGYGEYDHLARVKEWS